MKRKNQVQPSKKALSKLRAKTEEIGEIWNGFDEEAEGFYTDVLGSYTGTPEDKQEAPTQDADDL